MRHSHKNNNKSSRGLGGGGGCIKTLHLLFHVRTEQKMEAFKLAESEKKPRNFNQRGTPNRHTAKSPRSAEQKLFPPLFFSPMCGKGGSLRKGTHCVIPPLLPPYPGRPASEEKRGGPEPTNQPTYALLASLSPPPSPSVFKVTQPSNPRRLCRRLRPFLENGRGEGL